MQMDLNRTENSEINLDIRGFTVLTRDRIYRVSNLEVQGIVKNAVYRPAPAYPNVIVMSLFPCYLNVVTSRMIASLRFSSSFLKTLWYRSYLSF